MNRRRRTPGRRAALLAGLALVPGFAAAQSAPDRPPAPIPVFVDALETDDPELRPLLSKAVSEVAKRVARRRRWFRVVDSRDEAAATLRVTNYRTAAEVIPKIGKQILNGRVVMVEGSEILEFHYVDAVAGIGAVTRGLSGLDERETGSSLRNASENLAEELEDFCRENYDELTGDSPPSAAR